MTREHLDSVNCFNSLTFRSPSTCPTTPSPSTPASSSPTSTPKHSVWNSGIGTHTPGSTPKHSVHFHDPQLLKDGVLVTKVGIHHIKPQQDLLDHQVQCRMVSAKDILGRQKSPVRQNSGSFFIKSHFSRQVRLIQLSPSSSPLHLSSSSSPSTNGSSPHLNYSPNRSLPSPTKNSSPDTNCSPPIRCSPSRMKSCSPCPLTPSPSPSPSPHHTVSRASLTTRTH